MWFCTAVFPSNTYLLTQTYSPFLWSFPISCALFCRLLLNNNTPVTGSTSPTLIQVDVESCIFYCYFSPGSKVRSRSSVAAGIQTSSFNMAVFVEGLIGVIIFYIIILVIGLVAGRKKSSSADSQFLADRGLGLFVSSFTLSGKIVTGDDEHAVDMFDMSWQNFQAAMLHYRADFRLHARSWSSFRL